MRVTEITKRDSVVGNIQKNMARTQKLQTDIVSGVKINRTSDDPIGATVVQDITTSISQEEQILKNIHTDLAWLERNFVELNHIADLLTKARTLVLAQAGDTATVESTKITASEVQSIRDALFAAANARYGKLYLFSGTKTLTQPLIENNPIQSAKVSTAGMQQKDVAELLDVSQFKAQFEGFSTNPYRMQITKEGTFGKARYRVSDDGGLSWSGDKVLLPTVEIHNADSKADDKVLLRFTDDQGLLGSLLPNVATGSDFEVAETGVVFPEGIEFAFIPNPPYSYQGNRQKKEVVISTGTTVPLNITADELFLENGSENLNIFEMMNSIERAMIYNDGPALAQRVEQIELARNQVLDKTAFVGNTMRALENAEAKIEEQIYSRQKRLSEVRDLDMADAAMALNQADFNSKVSMDAGGRLLQPSLLSFLK